MRGKQLKEESVTSPLGFRASGMHAGIKANKRKFDCSLIVSEVPATSAGVFTINRAKAWPLRYNELVIHRKTHRVILANSGNANCFNGRSGEETVRMSLKLLSQKLRVRRDEILLASTGIIGKPFPIDRLKAAIPVLAKQLSRSGGHDAACGILTTDTCPKEIAIRFKIDGKQVTMGAMAKGAGMVNPQMALSGRSAKHATMLCFMTTDLAISKPMLETAFSRAVDKTFNCIAIDNDMSTNDTAVVLANGLAGNGVVKAAGRNFDKVEGALTDICGHLAKELVRDGEGVRHVCEVVVKGAANPRDARLVGKQILTSMLVKTMLAGEDPNWGRLVGSIGSSGAEFSEQLDIAFDGIFILRNGRPQPSNRSRVHQVLHKKDYVLEIHLKKGQAEGRFLMTDLTKFYVWINSAYSN